MCHFFHRIFVCDYFTFESKQYDIVIIFTSITFLYFFKISAYFNIGLGLKFSSVLVALRVVEGDEKGPRCGGDMTGPPCH
jgi:hypothetical protein